ENTRDNYHASLLHEFLVTFGLDRSTQTGGVKMDARHRHNITWAEADSDTDEFAHAAYAGAGVSNDFLSLKAPSPAIFRPHRASRPDPDHTTVIELGGGGVISDRDYRVTDVPLRGFWSYYAELLGIEPEGAVR